MLLVRRPLPSLRRPRRASGATRLLIALALLASIAHCGGAPLAPAAARPTVSGYVYQTATAAFGEPWLETVLITVEQADGSQHTALTNAGGFYTVSVLSGLISISATKAGFETNRSQFDLVNSTVLNFSLTPIL
jgi:hypothetical protein